MITHRQARRKVGSRTNRRAGTKTMAFATGKKGQAIKGKKWRRPTQARPAVRVARLVKESSRGKS
jgi:hypothetical protein